MRQHGNVEVPTINQPVASMGEASAQVLKNWREGLIYISQCVYAKNYMVCNMAILHTWLVVKERGHMYWLFEDKPPLVAAQKFEENKSYEVVSCLWKKVTEKACFPLVVTYLQAIHCG